MCGCESVTQIVTVYILWYTHHIFRRYTGHNLKIWKGKLNISCSWHVARWIGWFKYHTQYSVKWWFIQSRYDGQVRSMHALVVMCGSPQTIAASNATPHAQPLMIGYTFRVVLQNLSATTWQWNRVQSAEEYRDNLQHWSWRWDTKPEMQGNQSAYRYSLPLSPSFCTSAAAAAAAAAGEAINAWVSKASTSTSTGSWLNSSAILLRSGATSSYQTSKQPHTL